MASGHDAARGSRSRTFGVGETHLVALGVYVVAVLAWLAMLRQWLPMPGMGSGMAMDMTDPGVPEMMATGAGFSGWALYLLMWGVMMIAMMYPSSVPLVRMYHGTLDEAGYIKRAAVTATAASARFCRFVRIT